MKTNINNNELNNLINLFTNVINNDIISIQQYLNSLKNNVTTLINTKSIQKNPETFMRIKT